MFGLGDSVRGKVGNQEVLTVVAVRTEALYLVQRGNDAASQDHIKGSDLELVTKAENLRGDRYLYPVAQSWSNEPPELVDDLQALWTNFGRNFGKHG